WRARECGGARFGLDWAGFSRALAAAQPGNDGGLLLPWFVPEITPSVAAPGIRRSGLEPEDGPANVRGVVEAQMLSMALHSRWMQVAFDTIHATGGASANREILQVTADVFGAEVRQLVVENSACLGAALRARHAHALAEGRPLDWDTIIRRFHEPQPPPHRTDSPRHHMQHG